MPEYTSPKRVNDIILGKFEKPALQWLVRRMPDWATPDLLTVTGVFGALVIFIGYALTNIHPGYLWLCSLGFLINWFGDSLDGTLARYRKIERPKYGFFVDHLIDAFVSVLMFLGLGITPYIHFNVACLLLISYLLLCVFIFLNTSVNGVFQISFIHFGPTEMRALAIILNTAMFFLGTPGIRFNFGFVSIYDMIATALAVALFVVFLYAGTTRSVELARLERQTPKPVMKSAPVITEKQTKESV